MAHAMMVVALLFFAGQLVSSPQAAKQMNIESSSFAPGQPIPQKYTCEGGDASPQLRWSNAPQGTKTFTLIADDPDAPGGTWVHWVVYNIPADTHELRAGLARTATNSAGAQGLNDFRKIGYGGPCPPPGKPHRYFFKLYALDTELSVKPKAMKSDIESAMQGHILANSELIGTYRRQLP